MLALTRVVIVGGWHKQCCKNASLFHLWIDVTLMHFALFKMHLHIITALASLFLVTGCTPAPAEVFVRSKLPGDFRNLFYSPDNSFLCGEVGNKQTGVFFKFYSNYTRKVVIYEGDEGYSLSGYAKACGVGMTADQVEAEEERLAAEKVEREKADLDKWHAEQARKKQEQWLRENEKSLRALQDAVDHLQGR